MAPAVGIKIESIGSSSSTSSLSSLSSASGNTLSTLTKTELDRLIAENMASVLKSLKKRKHAKKHARIRQAAAAAAAMETTIADETNTTTAERDDEPENEAGKVAHGQKTELNIVRRRVSPRKNNQTTTAAAGPKSTATQKQNSLKALQPKTSEEDSDLGHPSDHSQSAGESNPQSQTAAEKNNGKENKTINAFQVMMRARSKAIGSNSPGKDLEAVETNSDRPTPQSTAQEQKAKRKLQLEQWAERKGSGKRKLQEDAEGEYIEHQLKKRAKRLKKLIGNMIAEDGEETHNSTPNGGRATSPEPRENGRHKAKPDGAAIQSKQSNDRPLAANGSQTKSAKTVEKENAVVTYVEIEDTSNDEFLNKLSSPRKKKDSLLGYFAKVSPEVGKKGTRQSGLQAVPSEESTSADGSKHATSPSEITSRPRRSCANRIKDYAAFERYSPEKAGTKKNDPTVTPLKIINVQSPSAMKVVKSPSLRMFCSGEANGSANGEPTKSEWPTTPKSVKLAPVFSRTAPSAGGGKQQPVIDPEKARARQLFLMSGIPEKMRQDMEKRAAYEEQVLNESPVFPLVSHVMQLGGCMGVSTAELACDLGRSSIRLRPVQPESPSGRGTAKAAKARKIRFGLFTSCSVDDYEDALIKCVEMDDLDGRSGLDPERPEIENAKDMVRDYKQRYQHFPVFKCYKQFRSIYEDYEVLRETQASDGDQGKPSSSLSSCRPAQNGLSRMQSSDSLDGSIEIIEPTFHNRNGELLFTEKYKPQNTEQILVNYVPATLLKRFLAPWQDDGGSAGATSGVSRRTNNGATSHLYGDYFSAGAFADDGDDFEQSNGSTSSASAEVCNHVVLVGPTGCGKTCNVYAVAKEMNFNVLEINASSRRKGKIILQELLEATQSHQVRQRTERSNSTDGAIPRQKATAGGGGIGGSKKGCLLNVAGGFSCLERRPSFCETNGNGSKKLSLILIEDADIVFDQDDGFLGAINQLVATSKRPIVLTTTNPSCPHMARYMARNNVIRYVAPGIANVAKFLSLLSLVERIPIDQYDLGRLYAHNGKDMRKTLNELQFFIQSGGDMKPALGDDEPDDMEGHGGNHPVEKAAKQVPNGSQQNEHTTLYKLFSRNQNEEMVLRLPLAFDTLWCNMELVLREAKAALDRTAKVDSKKTPSSPSVGKPPKRVGGTPKRQRRRDTGPPKTTQPTPADDLGFLYENISRAEASWGVTLRNRERYGRELQDEQQQQQLASEMGHALVEGSWIGWFDRTRLASGAEAVSEGPKGADRKDGADGAKAYDSLRKLEQEQSQTIASYIGVNCVRSRVTACDYEPFLRQICRTERDRSSQERRGSRFYHYLRNFISTSATPFAVSGGLATGGTTSSTAGGFSLDHLEVLSHRFEEQQRYTIETTESQPQQNEPQAEDQ